MMLYLYNIKNDGVFITSCLEYYTKNITTDTIVESLVASVIRDIKSPIWRSPKVLDKLREYTNLNYTENEKEKINNFLKN